MSSAPPSAAPRAVTLFHHPGAGEGEWSARRLREALRKAGYDPAYCCMEDHEDEGWRAELAATTELAVVAGGDGTVSLVATHLPNTHVKVAILPTGSGNNIARSLGIFDEIGEIVRRLPHAAGGPCRICRAEGPWGVRLFLEAVGLGALAHGTAKLQDEKLEGDEKRERGRESLIEVLEEMRAIPASVEVDGRAVQIGDCLILEVMNLPMVGANLRLVPDVPWRDRQLTVAFLPASERGGMVDWLRSGAVGPSPLRQVCGRVVTLGGEPQPLRLEDKTLDWDGSPVRLSVEPHDLCFLRPRDTR